MGSLWTVTLRWDLQKPLPSAANLREHWAVKAKRVEAQRKMTALRLKTQGLEWLAHAKRILGNERMRVGCILTRVAPRQLDDDNLQSAFKALRDEVAAQVGIDDGSDRWHWEYHQRKGAPGVEVVLQILQPEVER